MKNRLFGILGAFTIAVACLFIVASSDQLGVQARVIEPSGPLTAACSGCEVTTQTQVVTLAGYDVSAGSTFIVGPTPLGSGRAWLFAGTLGNVSYSHSLNLFLRNDLGAGWNTTVTIPAGRALSYDLNNALGLSNGTYYMVITSGDSTPFVATTEQLLQ